MKIVNSPAQVATPDRTVRRKTLLAGAASLLVVGSLFGVQIVGRSEAQAQTPAPIAAPTPQSFTFAPIVDRVRPAVVSIRVKGEAPATRESFVETFPELPEGGPLDRFFR